MATLAEVLDSLGVALCLFDAADRTILWNRTFLQFFPEHAGQVHAGEDYSANLHRFYRNRLDRQELANIDQYVADGVARHRAQSRPYMFMHGGRLLRVASLPMPGGGRVRVWTNLPEGQPVPSSDTLVQDRVHIADLADGAMVLDAAGRIRAVNAEFLSLYDAANEAAVVGRSFAEIVADAWAKAGPPADIDRRLAGFIDNARFSGAAFEVELPNDRWRRVIERRVADGSAYLSHADITVLKRQQIALSEAGQRARAGEARYRLLTENAGDIIVSLGYDLSLHFVSPAIGRVLGWDAAELDGESIEALINPGDREAFHDTVLGAPTLNTDGQAVLRCRLRQRRGGWTWMEAHIRQVPPGTSDTVRAICTFRDVTGRVAAEVELQEAYRRLETLAVTDALTGLANRRGFEEAMLTHRAALAVDGAHLSLLLIDIDLFKRINDGYGHQAGDTCLQLVGAIIQNIVRRDGDLVARYGGEEFAVVLPGTPAPGAASVADAIRAAIAANRDHDYNRDTPVTVSIGVVTAQGGGTPPTLDTLIAAADRALYRAKRAGRNRTMAAG